MSVVSNFPNCPKMPWLKPLT